DIDPGKAQPLRRVEQPRERLDARPQLLEVDQLIQIMDAQFPGFLLMQLWRARSLYASPDQANQDGPAARQTRMILFRIHKNHEDSCVFARMPRRWICASILSLGILGKASPAELILVARRGSSCENPRRGKIEMELLLHIVDRDIWARAKAAGSYEPE